MASKEQDENRGSNGRFLSGHSGNPKGRPKGSRNAVTMTVKGAVLESLEQLGGVDYLVKLGREHPELYSRMLLQILPKVRPESADDDDYELWLHDPDPDV